MTVRLGCVPVQVRLTRLVMMSVIVRVRLMGMAVVLAVGVAVVLVMMAISTNRLHRELRRCDAGAHDRRHGQGPAIAEQWLYDAPQRIQRQPGIERG